jgi:hypothetical protein
MSSNSPSNIFCREQIQLQFAVKLLPNGCILRDREASKVETLEISFLFCVFRSYFLLQLILLSFDSCSTRSCSSLDILAVTTELVYAKNENSKISETHIVGTFILVKTYVIQTILWQKFTRREYALQKCDRSKFNS